jgi:LacI family transcriptional regulator, repressor for deo operon, udp, cdd, tsx, nupC, and nupG
MRGLFMSTIEQVALLAKVSVATVSRVVNNSAYVSETTRERVEQAIKKLNYQPNALGKLLRKETTSMVLVLLHSVDNPFFATIVQGIEKVAHENDYNVLICNTYGDTEREQHYLKMLRNHLVDGVVFISNTCSAEEINYLNSTFPVVQVVEYLTDIDAAHYSIDFYQAGKDLMDILYKNGHRSIGFIHTGSTEIVSSKEKFRAYKDFMKERRLPLITNYPDECLFGYANAKKIAGDLLDKNPKTSAFFATSDLLACGIIDELNSRGKSVPKDAMVVGFDNTSYAYVGKPNITSVELNSFQLGAMAMEYLMSKIKNKPVAHNNKCLIPYQIIERESTKKM